jgi:hypothetical protein
LRAKSKLFSMDVSSSATLAERPRMSSAGALLMERVGLFFPRLLRMIILYP